MNTRCCKLFFLPLPILFSRPRGGLREGARRVREGERGSQEAEGGNQERERGRKRERERERKIEGEV